MKADEIINQIAHKAGVANTVSKETLEAILQAANELEVDFQNIKSAPSIQEDKLLFDLPFDEYQKLPVDKQREIQRRACVGSEKWINEELKRLNAKWILVCGGKTIDFSDNLGDYPSEEKLMTIGRKFNRIPFAFVEMPQIEEMGAKWSKITSTDYYPTVEIIVGKANWDNAQIEQFGEVIIGDLDTGAPGIFLDYGVLLSKEFVRWSSIMTERQAYHLGKRYFFYLLKVKIGLKDETGDLKTQDFHCYCIQDWEDCPFRDVNPGRQALVGRNILMKFSLHVILDSKNATTIIHHV